MKPVSTRHCLQHNTWGDNCDGWNLVEEGSLSVKQERMPAKTAEAKHYHKQAQQFFYILKGIAQFEIESAVVTIAAGEGIHIKPGQQHRILNNADEALEFLLCSQPSTINDRINCD